VGTTANWDNIVLTGPAVLPSLMATRTTDAAVTGANLPQYERVGPEGRQIDRLKQP
jgi:hypothetical protein